MAYMGVPMIDVNKEMYLAIELAFNGHG
jgi:hypothetical protein